MKWLGLVIVLCFGLSVSGNQISKDEARIVAVNWLNSTSDLTYSEENIHTVFSKSSGDTLLLFLVSFKPSGWVMVSATDKVEPVLGYSTNSSIDPLNLPVQMREWIVGLEHEIKYSYTPDYLPEQQLIQKWAKSKSKNTAKVPLKSAALVAVGPLLSCTWDQGRFYNEMAPYDPSSSAGNNHVWIGCVATAMAQLMKYWEYPTQGSGTNSYQHPVYGLQLANFGATQYNWGAMPNQLNAENSEVQKISYHTAVSVNMDFNPQGSGAFLEDAQEALINYFNYNSTIFEPSKSEWDDAAWKNQLKKELNNGRPVIYSGYNPSGFSGHAFVCDGYTNDYFHFNWGWAGYANGNFLLSALNPGGSNYSYDQIALMGIEPVENSPVVTPYSEGFESGSAGYIKVNGVSNFVSSEKHSGNLSLQLSQPAFSSYSKNSASLAFLVPADCHLSFWVKRKTPVNSAYNHQKATLLTQYGQTVLSTIFEGDFNDDDWVNYSINLKAYQGQFVRLMFTQQNFDVAKEQWMFIDDVVITGTGENLAPFTPAMPVPEISSIGVSLTPQLRWSGGDPNGDFVKYYLCFGTDSNPVVSDTVTENRFSPEVLNHSITYYWKVIADDGQIKTAGPVWSFTTRNLPPDMSLCGIIGVTKNAASVCGKVMDDNNSTISELGICWSTTPNPSIGNFYKSATQISGSYSCDLQNLKAYQTYYVKAYAKSSEGIAYSNEQSFRTLADIPVLNFPDVSDITRTTAKINGPVQSKNDEAILNRGVVWSNQQGFDPINGNQIIENGNWANEDTFSIFLNGLPGPSTIYFRTFAENSVGRNYSTEAFFETFNTAPEIDLDANNSSQAAYSQFFGTATEQELDGRIADSDVLIHDADNDSISQITIILSKQFDDENEYLILQGEHLQINVTGNRSDTLILAKNIEFANELWTELLQNVILFVDSDAPAADLVREVEVLITDGYNSSEPAVAFLSVVEVNDAPINLQLPVISGTPLVNSELHVIQGLWNDSADETICPFTLTYQWQVKKQGVIKNIEGQTNPQFLISENFCGDSVRVVETVADANCGGNNEVKAEQASNWLIIQKTTQQVTFNQIPVYAYTKKPFTLNAESSSGLPVYFSMNVNSVAHISNNEVFIDAVGRTVVTASQPGNTCYLSAEQVNRLLTVETGSQQIICDNPDKVSYTDGQIPLFAASTAGLPLQVLCSDTTIATVKDDTIYLKGIGTVHLIFTQSGNEYVTAAEPIEADLTIEKGHQLLMANVNEEYRFGDGLIDLNVEVSSRLDPIIEISDTSVIRLIDGKLQIVGVGNCEITLTQPGNEFYLPANKLNFVIHVSKGIQQFSFPEMVEKHYGDEDFELPVLPQIGLTSFNIDIEKTGIISENNEMISVVGVGNTEVHFNQSGNELWESYSGTILVKILKGIQLLTFQEMEEVSYGDVAMIVEASTNSGLEVGFTSSNTNVAEVSGDSILIKNAGQTNITAIQKGNEYWDEADSVTQLLLVNKAKQTIETVLPDTLTLQSTLSLSDFQASSGLPVNEVISSNEKVIKVDGNNLTVLSDGTVDLTVSQLGNENYEAISKVFHFYVSTPVSVESIGNIPCSIFPNPARNQIHISLEKQSDFPAQLRLLSTSGQELLVDWLHEQNSSINISMFPVGLYFLTIQTKSGVETVKIVIEY